MSEQGTGFSYDGWADIQFMGHRRLVGRVRTDQIGGTAIFVVEVPNDAGAFDTEIYAASALYAFKPMSEELARAIAGRVNPAPINPYELPDDWCAAISAIEREKRDKARAIEAASREEDDDDGDAFDPDDVPL